MPNKFWPARGFDEQVAELYIVFLALQDIVALPSRYAVLGVKHWMPICSCFSARWARTSRRTVGVIQ